MTDRRILRAVAVTVAAAIAQTVPGAPMPAAAEPETIVPLRTWHTPDPLYEELFSDQPRTFSGRAAFTWVQMFNVACAPSTDPKPVALQHGIRYSFDEWGALYGRLKIPMFGSYPGRTKEFDWVVKRYGIKGVLPRHLHGAGAGDNANPETPAVPEGRRKGSKLFMDPSNLEHYLRQTEQWIDDYPGYWWGVSIGDEPLSYTKSVFMEFMKYKDEIDYPFFDQALVEIRDKYGYGKFGPPARRDEIAPFKWIAFNRWFLDQFVEASRRFHETVKGKDPNLVVIGEDTVSHLRATYYERYGKYVDIATGQHRPGQHRFRQYIGFKTKVTRDLSGKDTWMCPHIERFPGNFTPKEVTEYLSEAVRVGGTGFQFFPHDVHGNREKERKNYAHYEGLGAPARQAAILAVVDRLRNMPVLNFPKADAAILFSNDSCLSRDRAVYFEQYEGAFTFLGPFARAAFEFTSDRQLEDDRRDLARYKAVVIPFATYQEKGMSERIAAYAEAGGNVLCTDPQVFGFHLDGSQTPEFAERMFGVQRLGVKPWPDAVVLSANPIWPDVKDGDRLPVYKPKMAGGEKEGAERDTQPGLAFVFNIESAPGTTVLGHFPDGSPAIVMKNHGAGRAVYFTFNPFYREYFMGPHETDYVLFKAGKIELATLDSGWLFKRDPAAAGQRDGWYEAAFDHAAWGPGTTGTSWENETLSLTLGREQQMDLTPDWLFAIDPDDKGVAGEWFRAEFDRHDWIKTSVGRNWQEFKKGYYGSAWYARKFRVPADRKDRALELLFEGVDEDCWVYLNEKEIFSRESKPMGQLWDRPFRIAVTEAIRDDDENLLVVRVRKTAFQTGIYKPVRLMAEVTGGTAGKRMADEPLIHLNSRQFTVEFGHRYLGLAWYANTFELAAADIRDRAVYVHFQDVRNDAVVYVNGRYCGRYWGRKQPFAVDATDAARVGENLLVIRVQNERHGGGIHGPVRIFTGTRGVAPVDRLAGYPAWAPVFESIFKGMGIETGHDIWRFQFPMPKQPQHRYDARCLTGNHARWEMNQWLTDGVNEKVDGLSYRYSVPPDDIADEVNEDGTVAFDSGNLTDRLAAPWAGSVMRGTTPLSKWVVRWRRSDPVTITFDLARKRALERVRLIYTDEMPRLSVLVSSNGETFSPVVSAAGREPTHAVLDMDLAFGRVDARYVRLAFDQRNFGSLYLSEVELWGE